MGWNSARGQSAREQKEISTQSAQVDDLQNRLGLCGITHDGLRAAAQHLCLRHPFGLLVAGSTPDAP